MVNNFLQLGSCGFAEYDYSRTVFVGVNKMAGIKVALGNRRMTAEAARKIGKSGQPWYISN